MFVKEYLEDLCVELNDYRQRIKRYCLLPKALGDFSDNGTRRGRIYHETYEQWESHCLISDYWNNVKCQQYPNIFSEVLLESKPPVD